MTDASNNSSYLLVYEDSADLPNSKVLDVGNGLELDDTGSTITINPRDNLLNLTQFTAGGPGYVTYSSAIGFGTVSMSSNSTINIPNSIGVGGNNSFSVIKDTTYQKVNVHLDNLQLSTASIINIIPAGSSSISIVDVPGSKRTDITIGLPGIITPADGTYILQKEDSRLQNAEVLEFLATGIVKNTTATGELSIAIPNVDYQAASANLTQISSLTHNVGDIIFYNSGPTYAILPAGAPGTIFSAGAGAITFPEWRNLAGEGSVTSVGMLCTDGSMIVAGSPVTHSGNIGIILTSIISPASYNLANITVDLHGRITAISTGTVTGTVSSFGLTASASRFSLGGTNPITTSGTITADTRTTSVVAGDYVNTHLTIDEYGRITNAEEGNLVWSFSDPAGNSITPYPNHGYITQSSTSLVFATWGLFNDPIVGDEFYFCVDINAPFSVRTSGGQVYGPSPLPGSFGILTMSPGSSVRLVCTVPSPSRSFQVVSFTGPISIS